MEKVGICGSVKMLQLKVINDKLNLHGFGGQVRTLQRVGPAVPGQDKIVDSVALIDNAEKRLFAAQHRLDGVMGQIVVGGPGLALTPRNAAIDPPNRQRIGLAATFLKADLNSHISRRGRYVKAGKSSRNRTSAVS